MERPEHPWLVSAVASARVARLATHDAGGRIHLVPCCYALAQRPGWTVYSAVDGKPKRSTALRRLDNVAADPDAALLVDRYDDDWSTLWWVRLRGAARVVSDPAEITTALDLLVARYEQYRQERPAGPVLALDVDDWQGWRARPVDPAGQ